MKKFVALLLCLALCLPCFVVPAYAEETERETFKSGGYEYVILEDGTAEIRDCLDFARVLTLPEELDGHVISSIGNMALVGRTSVTIPDSVTSIDGNPFAGCTSIVVSPNHPTLAIIDGVLFSKTDKRLICYPCRLTSSSYEIPQDINIIGDYAFVGCSLTSLTIPESVTSIGANPFALSWQLKTITVSPDHPTLATIDGVLFSKVDKRLVCYPCTLTASSYGIPQGIKLIGDFAFYFSKRLTSLTIPDSVTSIGVEAFEDCESLTSVTIPDSVTSIGDRAFSGCTSLTSVAIPDSVAFIGDEAFRSCHCLTSVTIPDSVTSIGDRTFFNCTGLTSVTISDSVSSIGEDAFTKCRPQLTVTVGRDSYAREYCEANGLNYTYPDANDWLTA